MKHLLSLVLVAALLAGCTKKNNTESVATPTGALDRAVTTVSNNETTTGSEGLLTFSGTMAGNYVNNEMNAYVAKDTSYACSMTLLYPDTGKVRITGSMIKAEQNGYAVNFPTEMINLVFDKRADGVYSYSPQRHTNYTLKVVNNTTIQFAKHRTGNCAEVNENIVFNGGLVK